MDRRWEVWEVMEGQATLKVIFRKQPGGRSSDKGLSSWSIGWVSIHPKGQGQYVPMHLCCENRSHM